MNLDKRAKETLDSMNALYTRLAVTLPSVKFYLKDYLHKLERDDFDPNAVEKMQGVNAILDELEGRVHCG